MTKLFEIEETAILLDDTNIFQLWQVWKKLSTLKFHKCCIVYYIENNLKCDLKS